MKPLPSTENALVLRTDFSDEDAWRSLRAAIETPEPRHGFRAYVEFVSDPAFAGLTIDQLLALSAQGPYRSYIFVVDELALTHPERPVLVVELDPEGEPGRSFRAIPAQMASVENNLSIANMDFEDFAGSADADGIFRGFPESPGMRAVVAANVPQTSDLIQALLGGPAAMKILLRIEELALAVLAFYLFLGLGYAWWWFLVLFLAPDISMLGYLVGPRAGAWTYNAVHFKAVAVALFILGTYLQVPWVQGAALIMFGHSSLDRVFGYGLKYTDAFQHTHLGWIGRPAADKSHTGG